MNKIIDVDKKHVESVLNKLRKDNLDTFKVNTTDFKFASMMEDHLFCLICTEIVNAPE
jgi:hypothetical protein